MYKLVVLDIDGTILDEQGRLSEKTVQTIACVQKQGALVTVCTGRNIKKSLPVMKAAGLTLPFVCMDGTLLYDPLSDKLIRDLRLTEKEAMEILHSSHKPKVYLELSDGHHYYKFAEKKELLQYDIFNKHTLFGHMKSYFGGVRYLRKFTDFYQVKEPYYQVIVGGSEETITEIKEDINKKRLDRVEIRDYLWPGFLFINRKGIKKSNGVKMLCEYFDISMEEVITIGDERNDIDMIEMAGMGIAMGNAVESVKAVADYVTGSNEENGVAMALEKFFL